MAYGKQKVTIIGNLGRDPEIKTFQSGNQVVTFSVAVTESYKSKSGEKVENTEWFNCEMWGDRGNIIAQFAKKGSRIWIEGKQRTNSDEKNGVKREFKKLMVNEFLLLDSRNSQDNASKIADLTPSEPELADSEFSDEVPF